MNDCSCITCRYNRGELSNSVYRVYLLDNLRSNPNNDKVESFSELKFDEDCMALYELETNGNAFTDKNVDKKIAEILEKYGIPLKSST